MAGLSETVSIAKFRSYDSSISENFPLVAIKSFHFESMQSWYEKAILGISSKLAKLLLLDEILDARCVWLLLLDASAEDRFTFRYGGGSESNLSKPPPQNDKAFLRRSITAVSINPWWKQDVTISNTISSNIWNQIQISWKEIRVLWYRSESFF